MTAANASTMNDGAAAVLLMSGEKIKALGLKPLAKIISFADAEHDPKWFTTAPSLALPKALNKANLTSNDRRLCALIKLNMSTKDISSITYQSTQTIKVARYRLRKKLGVEKNENLTTFLNAI